MNLKALNMDISADSCLPMALRYAAYTILIFAVTISLPTFLQNESIAAFKEGGWVECCQLMLLGHGDFLQSLMGDNYDRSYKRVIEESLELMGYILVFAGTIEASVELRAEPIAKPAFKI
ncbi:MAG: hypothetical protein ACLFNS_06860 [Desulfobacterales bacterium]